MIKQLEKVAAEIGCYVQEEKGDCIEVVAPEGRAWERGQLTALVAVYGNCKSYLPEWRRDAIKQLIEDCKSFGEPQEIN
jgi:hypothetical protein